MASTSRSEEKPSRSESKLSHTLGEGSQSIDQRESRASSSSTLMETIQTSTTSHSYPRREQRIEEIPGPRQLPQHVPSSSDSALHADKNEEVVITRIRATDVTLGLRRLPAGFYTAVHHSSLEWRTEIKQSSVDDDVVEWNEPIPIQLDLSAIICLEVYASFEFQPMLGVGEQLRRLTITVEQLLERSANDVPFVLFPKNEDIVSPCSSISVTVRRGQSKNPSASRVLGPYDSTTESRSELADATNQGHNAFSRYRRHESRWDLQRSIEEFERALSVCPLDHPCRAAAQSNLAMAKFIQCQVEGSYALLDIPLGLYCDALAARPVGHVDRPATLIQLAAVHLAQYEKGRDDVRGAQAKTLLHEAMGLVSAESHARRAASFMLELHARRRVGPMQLDGQPSVEQGPTSRLTNEELHMISIQLLYRFKRTGDLADLQQVIALLEELVRSTSNWDDWYRVGLGNLSAALLYRFEHLGDLGDLENAISILRDAVNLIPHCHPDKPAYLSNLGVSLKNRFRCLGEFDDLENAISTFRDAVTLIPDAHPDKPARLGSLGNCFNIRFERLGELHDVEDAISSHRDAVNLTPHGHPEKPTRLNDLGTSFSARFECMGELGDVEAAILSFREAIDLTLDGHPDKPNYLSNLGTSLSARFESLGRLSDIEDAISTLRSAVDLTSCGHPHKPTCLSNLAIAFSARFEQFGELNDLEEAISMYRDAVDLTPDGHPDKPFRLNNLATSYFNRFKRLGELSDLEDAISRHKDAIDQTPHDHPQMHVHLNNLGNTLSRRFHHLGELGDVDDAILMLKGAVNLTPDCHPHKPSYLNNLGNTFRARFERLGELMDLEEAILALRDSVNLTPNGHPDKPGHVGDLSNTLNTRFQRFGDLGDLEDAISMLRHAVNLAPGGHPHKPGCLRHLGNSFKLRFNRLGELSDLEDAISSHRHAVELTPHGHPEKPGCLSNLGLSLLTRFKHLGELSDLEDAISVLRDSIDLTPCGHPDKPLRLNNFATSLETRFDHLGELNDLEEAISIARNAVELTPRGHPDMPIYLNNLGGCFSSRFDRLGELSDLEDTILRYKGAVNLTPRGHPRKPGCLSNLGNAFKTRFKYLKELSDLDSAISRCRDAVDLIPDDHSDKPGLLGNLANCFEIRFEHSGGLSDLEHALFLYSHAACTAAGSIRVRFQASQKWISCARRVHHHSLLHACSVAVSLLPQLAWIGLSLTNRYSQIVRGADVVREAAATALDLGLLETAVEWLEQGRSIVWGDQFQLRNPYEELSSAHPDHARRLRELSSALEHASTTHEKTLSTLSEQTQSAGDPGTESLQRQADRHRALAIERDKLLQEIRCFPGFERFLLRKQFHHLRASAHSGPVVILNAAESRCDALIILADVDHVIHVPLPNFTFRRSTDLQNTLKGFLRHAREGRSAPWNSITWESFLSPLWKCVVKPVLDALAFSTPGDLSRIFWCPTGPFVFLPIHAAGFYNTKYSQPGHKLSDFVVSSYVPTLDILALSLNTVVSSSDLRLLAVRQPPSDGLPRLPGVHTELEHIRSVVKDSLSTRSTLLESSVGTVEEVLSLMKDADWVHFACHGIQDSANPVDSGLCLADRRRLKMRDIIGLSRPHGGLAFLSACQTAMGDERLSDEATHIAAGMLFAGYGGVVGTMWSISDNLAPVVARDVYTRLLRNGTRPDYREAARALHEAIRRLRDSGKASFAEWVPFIHVGL